MTQAAKTAPPSTARLQVARRIVLRPRVRATRAWIASLLVAAALGAASGAEAAQRFAAAGYHSDGALAQGFNVDGVVTTQFPPEKAAGATGAAFDPLLGRLYLAGNAGDKIALAAYDASGNLDTSFGDAGRVLARVRVYKPVIRGLALDASGRLVVVGRNGDGWLLLARFLPDGTLDATFDGDGILQFAPGGSGYALFDGLAVAVDGSRIVVSGVAIRGDCQWPSGVVPGLDGGMLVARFLDNGEPDRTFGYDHGFRGYVIDNRTPGYCGYDPLARVTVRHFDEARDVAIDYAGRIVVAGVVALDYVETHDAPGVYDLRFLSVRRYLDDGRPDSSFGEHADGEVTSIDELSHANAVLVDDWGRILAAGQMRSYFGVARLTPDGELDPTWSGDGLTMTAFGTFGADEIADIALTADGQVVAGGWAGNRDGSLRRIAMARYRSDGTLETNFDGDGKLTTEIACKGNESVTAIALGNRSGRTRPGDIRRIAGEPIYAAGRSEGDRCLRAAPAAASGGAE